MIILFTAPNDIPEEEEIVNKLFGNGLHVLHLRKPGASRERYERFIRSIAPRYRQRIMVHDYPELAKEYGLRGFHLKFRETSGFIPQEGDRISVSCHSFEEIRELPFVPDHVFLSPVFDSISKQGYHAAFQEEELRDFLHQVSVPVIALGGVTAENTETCRRLGFAGVALLGYIWEQPGMAIQRFREIFPNTAMSIAGFDPSSGAGVTADIKTFEANGVYGLGVSTAITIQNQQEYLGTHWLSAEEILQQCECLARKCSPRFIKIGLIEHFETLHHVVKEVKKIFPHARVIWDPILKASAGFQFHKAEKQGKLEKILRDIYLLTPNTEEVKVLFGQDSHPEDLQKICRATGTNILWKGGHDQGNLSTDRLITPERIITFSVARSAGSKHGTGCVLSAAITSYLTLGYSLAEACRQGQQVAHRFIRSNNTNLGIHRQPEFPNLYAIPLQYITDYREDMSIPEQVEAVCRGGCRWVQLRMKEASRKEFLETGRQVKSICQRYGALFIINDNVELALELDADGVHLGKEDMNPLEARQILGYDKIIGGTCNTLEDIENRCRQQVDYIGLGPFTYTTTKKRLSPVIGLEGYRELMNKCREKGIHLPVHAIGGIKTEDIPSILATGVTGIALSSLLKNSENITNKTIEIINIIGYATIKNSR